MKKIKRWLRSIYLFPAMLMLGVDGDTGAVSGGGGDGSAPGDTSGGDTLLGGDGGQDDLSSLFTPDDVKAKKESIAAAKAEEERQAKLTPEEKKAEEDKKAAEEADKVVPEAYESFKVPDGMAVSPEGMEHCKAMFKEFGLSQGKAQKAFDAIGDYYKMETSRLLAAQNLAWQEQAKKDPEYGGAKLDSSLKMAEKALATFSTPEFSKYMRESCLGSHPEFIRLMVRIGESVSEDFKYVEGGANAFAPKTPEQQASVLYPKMKEQLET